MKIELTLKFQIDDQALEYMEEGMFEPGNIRYWGTPHRRKDGRIEIYVHGGELELEESPRRLLPKNWYTKGLQTLVRLKRPDGTAFVYSRIAELLRGDYDAESLDVLVQAAVLGEIIYG